MADHLVVERANVEAMPKLLLRRRAPAWQWFVLASGLAQILLFIITQPYTWNGSGGSVGNRYFMGAYGIFVFLVPPIYSITASVVPWFVGLLFAGKIVLKTYGKGLADEIAQRTRSARVGLIGHIVILYRRQPDPEKRTIDLP